MKRMLFMFVMSVAMLLPAAAAGETKEPSAAQLVQQTQRAKRQKDYLTAMVSATELLSRNPDNSFAKSFVYDNWDAMMRQMDDIVSSNADMNDVEQCVIRTRACSLLADVERNLNGVKMPLSGNGWSWQPEMLYTAGNYQSERINLSRLVRKQAAEALYSYDADELRQCYDRLLNTDLLFPDERESNRLQLLDDCNKRLHELAKARLTANDAGEVTEDNIGRRRRMLNDLLFADELATLSLTLDDSQTGIAELREELRTAIDKLYAQFSNFYIQQGDTVQAQVYRNAMMTAVSPDNGEDQP